MKKQKICITGSLGYIGSELCQLLSGEARYKDIICIDNRFISGRVQQLRDWGMQFYQGSILDREFLQQHLHDADVVYHLAGITDVAYTSTQSNPVQDRAITETGIMGTRNILNTIPDICRVIFPSTHVVYGGLWKARFDLVESDVIIPDLTYAQGKAQSESDIRNHQNHIIVRLGSVYGLSGDTMRMNIMPNLFSKIASQDGTISLYGSGIQYKSLINIHDVVRAMKYLAEGEYTGTYHLSNENMTVKQVAQICKEINSKVILIETDDEIPNQGYTLSNQKLIDTGFKFLYNIKDSIREMIQAWSAKPQPEQLEYIIRGGKEYADIRGRILNYELTEPINLIGWIESREYTVRANHYHPIQEQKCLLISGRYVSVTQDLSYPNAPIEYKVIHAGDIAVIRPNVAHAMVFLTDSIFLNLVRGEREHENYGITHTIPYELVAPDIRDEIIRMYRRDCRCCGYTDLKGSLSLGMSPLANNLLDTPDQHVGMYPLELEWCPHCYNVQLSCVVPPEKMFDNYLYVSSTSATFRNHFELAAQRYIGEFNLTSQSLILDIGSNDGVFLKPLQDRGIRVCGIEPARNIANLANANGIPTICGYFNQESAHNVYETYGSPDIITASNVFAHADDLAGITNTVFSLLKPDGVFIIEVQYIMDTIKDLTFDNIYHEHVNYWSVWALNYFFCNLGYRMFHVEHIDTHGGSIRCYTKREDGEQCDRTVEDFITNELQYGINSHSTFITFAQRVADIRTTVRRNMKLLKERFPVIAGYGSPAKATTALNYFGITSDDIQYTIEDNPLKHSKILPGSGIPITGILATNRESQGISRLPPDLVIVLAWNFYDSIRAKLTNDVSCISIKDLEIVDTMPILDTTTLTGAQSTGKVYDCFLFFNELDLLEMRLNILDSVVDYFVIVEANITHSGVPREYCYEANKGRFSKWSDRIIYIQVDDIPEQFVYVESIDLGGGAAELPDRSRVYNDIMYYIQKQTVCDLTNLNACREQWQRASIIRGLHNAQPDDIIMLSDIDEITNPDTLSYILANFDENKVYAMRMNSYYYYLNLLKETNWVGARIATCRKFQEYTPITFRHIRDTIMANGGWHFSYQTASGVQEKLQAYSHADMATEDIIQHLPERIQQGIDPYNRGQKLKRVEVDSTYPKYLLDNIDTYKHMIL